MTKFLIYIKLLIANLFFLYCLNNILADKDEKKRFFYDKTGILTIDGSVKGQSDPITLDMKATRLTCVEKQYFVFTFCPVFNLLKRKIFCEEGIIFCYEPILMPEYVRDYLVLDTLPNLDVSKKCGDQFRGFKVSLKRMRDMQNNYRLFYEFQTSYQEEPYYFARPDKICISLWLGNDQDLQASVRTVDKFELDPVQVRTSFADATPLGVDSETYAEEWPDMGSVDSYAESPSLKMLYLDFKSLEYIPQMMFTIGAESQCNLYARVNSNKVGKCQSGFKQKAMSLRAYGHSTNTTYTLTIESGVNTNDTKGTRSAQEKILSKEFEEGKTEETEETETDDGIQSYEENVSPTEEDVSTVTSSHTETKDITSAERKAAAALINTAAAIACGAYNVLTLGMSTCSANVEFKDIQTTTFHEKMTNSRTKNSKTTSSTNSVHSVQNVLQTAFTSSKGPSEITSHSEEKSMSNIVSTKKMFVYEVEVSKGKIMTPLQMGIACDGSSVLIPWLKFKIRNEGEAMLDEYGENHDDSVKEEQAPKDNDNNDDYDYSAIREISQQERDSEAAFEPPPATEDTEDAVYDEFVGDEPPPIQDGNGDPNDENVDYRELAMGEE